MDNRKGSAEIDDAAALWVARIEARTLLPEEEVELDEWLAGDVRHLGAFARAQAISIHMAKAQALGPDFFIGPDKN